MERPKNPGALVFQVAQWATIEDVVWRMHYIAIKLGCAITTSFNGQTIVIDEDTDVEPIITRFRKND